MPLLRVIIASTRPGRVGLPVGNWFIDVARAHGGFDIEVTDLAELALPFMDEPKHPRFREYTHDHTCAWSEEVDASDAFVFVMPEYNYTTAPALVNALDTVYQEWTYKPVGFVSYGGVSGGMRAVQTTKLMVTSFKMVPMMEAVNIPFFSTLMENGVFKGNELHDKAVPLMLDEMARWSDALKVLRA